MRKLLVIICFLLTNSFVFGQSEMTEFKKTEDEIKNLNKKKLKNHLSEYEFSSLNIISEKDSVIRNRKDTINFQNNGIENLENNISKLDGNINELEKNISELEKNISTKEKSIKNLNQKIKQNKEIINQDSIQIYVLNDSIPKLKTKLRNIQIQDSISVIVLRDSISNLKLKLKKYNKSSGNNLTKTTNLSSYPTYEIKDLLVTPKGFELNGKPYTGFVYKKNDEEIDVHSKNSYYLDFFGMVNNGLKYGIWITNNSSESNENIFGKHNGSYTPIGGQLVSKYEKGKIINGFNFQTDPRGNHGFNLCGLKLFNKSIDYNILIEEYKKLCTEFNNIQNFSDFLIVFNERYLNFIEIKDYSSTVSFEFISFKNGLENGICVKSSVYNRTFDDFFMKEIELQIGNVKDGEKNEKWFRRKYEILSSEKNYSSFSDYILTPIDIDETILFEISNYKDGKKNGLESVYERGIINKRTIYSNDLKNGLEEIYNEGIIVSSVKFKNGTLIQDLQFDLDGIIIVK